MVGVGAVGGGLSVQGQSRLSVSLVRCTRMWHATSSHAVPAGYLPSAATSARSAGASQRRKMANELRDKGIAIANEAVQHDNAQRYDEAIKGYVKAAEYLLTATKYEKNPVTLKVIRDKCTEYTERAEFLKKYLVNFCFLDDPSKHVCELQVRYLERDL